MASRIGMFSTVLAKIQVLMLQSDIERMQADPNFSLDSSSSVAGAATGNVAGCAGKLIKDRLFRK